MDTSSLMSLGRRLLAAIVLVAVVLLALKFVIGIVWGIVQFVGVIALLIGLLIVGTWAYRQLRRDGSDGGSWWRI